MKKLRKPNAKLALMINPVPLEDQSKKDEFFYVKIEVKQSVVEAIIDLPAKGT